MARRRAQWAGRQRLVDPARLVFIDETWTKTNMAPLRGWALRGQRLKAKVPHGHWKTMTFLAALPHDRVEAPWLLDGANQRRDVPALRRQGWTRPSPQTNAQITSHAQDTAKRKFIAL